MANAWREAMNREPIEEAPLGTLNDDQSFDAHLENLALVYGFNNDILHNITVLVRRMKGCLERGQYDRTEINRWIYALETKVMPLSPSSQPTKSAVHWDGLPPESSQEIPFLACVTCGWKAVSHDEETRLRMMVEHRRADHPVTPEQCAKFDGYVSWDRDDRLVVWCYNCETWEYVLKDGSMKQIRKAVKRGRKDHGEI